MRDRGLIAALLLLAVLPARAQNSPPPAESIADPRTGCRVWNAAPKPTQTIGWSGACPNQLADGRGVLRYFENARPTGDRYEGELHDGKANGSGAFIQADGARYDGAWRDGKRNGHGVFTWGSGNRYDGEWRDDKQNGHGVLTLVDGSRYDGEWRDDKADGRGVFTDARGRYEGEWRDDQRNGHGTFTQPDGSRYDGEWRDDKQTGRGVAAWANGERYDGEWRDDKPNGAGRLQTANGTFDGVWKDGCFRNGARHLAVGVDPSSCP
jgi:hypothetical protein